VTRTCPPDGGPSDRTDRRPNDHQQDSNNIKKLIAAGAPIGEIAVAYATAGFLVFPLNRKLPAISKEAGGHGMKDGTTDLETVRRWWTERPWANIGCRVAEDQALIDVDPRHGGDQTWAKLQETFGPVRRKRLHGSGRNDSGGHQWFCRPAGKLSIDPLDRWAEERGLGMEVNGKWTSGIDLLHHGHRYTILPPSVHPDTGEPYFWPSFSGPDDDPAEMPAWLADLVTAEEEELPVIPAPRSTPVADSIVERYSAETSWCHLLTTAGWSVTAGDGDSDGSKWRHPEATNAYSATITNGCLFVYSPLTDFEVTKDGKPHGYTKFKAAAILKGYGDTREGRSAFARSLMPSRPLEALLREQGSDKRADPANSDPGRRTIALTAASSIKPRPVRWLWDGRIATGTLGLVGGREGIGKSTTTYQITADITRGRLPGAYHGKPKAVIVAATEDSWEHTIVPRLMAADADLDLVYRVDVATSAGFNGSLSLPGDLDALRELVVQVDAAMVLLDPLMSRLDARLDTHKDAEVRLALEPLVALADRCEIAVIGLIHVNKSTSTDPLTMLMASRAFAAVARAVLFVTVDPDNPQIRFLGQPKNNLGRTDLPCRIFTIQGVKVADSDEGPVWTAKIVWEGETDRTIDEILRTAAETNDTRAAVAEAAAWLTDYLQLHPVVPSKQVKQDGSKADHSENSLKRARHKIGAGVKPFGFPRTTYWSKPGLDPDEVDRLLAISQSDQPSGISHGESDLTGLTGPTGQSELPMAQSDQSDQSDQSPETCTDCEVTP
jgi:hypothetical protein